MKYLLTLTLLVLALPAFAGNVTYQVDGNEYEGYALKKSSKAPTVLLIHDWDGLTDYEIKRAKMLKKMGHDVVEYANGFDALETLESPHAPNLAILDWEKFKERKFAKL